MATCASTSGPVWAATATGGAGAGALAARPDEEVGQHRGRSDSQGGGEAGQDAGRAVGDEEAPVRDEVLKVLRVATGVHRAVAVSERYFGDGGEIGLGGRAG